MRQLMALLTLVGCLVAAGPAAAAVKPPRFLPPPNGATELKTGPDADVYAPGAIIEGTGPEQDPGGVTTLAGPSSGTYWCALDYVTVSSFPSGYATGNCPALNHLYVTQLSDLADGNYYRGGYIDGQYSGCGWIRTGWLNYMTSSTTTGCSSPSYGNCTFIYCTNPNDPNTAYIWADGTGEDGLNVTMTKTCQLYGNYRPWLSGQTPTTSMHLVNQGTIVKMRYMARYTYAGGWYIMVHDLNPAYPTGKGNWGFLATTCIS